MSNPVVAVGGYLVGRRVGGLAGSIVASYVYDKVRSGKGDGHFVSVDTTKRGDGRFVRVDTTKNSMTAVFRPDDLTLSDGEIHNIVLLKLMNDSDKYIKEDGTIMYDSLINMAIKYEQSLFGDKDSVWVSEADKKQIAIETQTLVETAAAFDKDYDENTFHNAVYKNLSKNLSITRSEFTNLNSLNMRLPQTYIGLSEKQATSFASDVNKIIDASALNHSTKNTLKSSNSVLLHSDLFWKGLNK